MSLLAKVDAILALTDPKQFDAATQALSRGLGFARVAFDAQTALGETEPTEKWVALRPNKFNGKAKNCWRLDLDFN